MTSFTHNINDFALWTALVTPFTADGNIDFPSLSALVAEQQAANNAILLCGSTGEGLALETAEQLSIVKFVCELKPSVPLMVAVGGYNLQQQLAWIEQCNTLAIDAYLLTAPIYAKPGVVGQTQWFKALMDASDNPCMIYNVPSRSGVSIDVDCIANLAKHPNMWAMKEASGDINQFLAYQQAAPKVKMFSGEDGLMPYLASAGAVGLVSVCSNAWPQATHCYVQKSVEGGHDPKLFAIWSTAIDSLFEVANPIPVKVLMHKKQTIKTPLLRAPLTHLELVSDQRVISADAAIQYWYVCNNTAQTMAE